MKQRSPSSVLLAAVAASSWAAELLTALETDGPYAISLDGSEWRFELDDGSDGLRPGQEWYRPAHPEPADSIRVPGSWGSQGFGVRSNVYRHAWSGVGWYYRNVTIPPSWCALMAAHDAASPKRSAPAVVLTIGGVMRRGRAWIDGVELGAEHIGYLDEWSMAVEPAAICDYARNGGVRSENLGSQPDVSLVQQRRLTVRVDNRANHSAGDCFSGCLDLRGMEAVLQVADEHTPVGMEWGGIWDHVSLRYWHPNSVSDLFVFPADPERVVWGVSAVDLFVNITLRQPATASTSVQLYIAQDSPLLGGSGAEHGDSDMHVRAVAEGSVVIPVAAQSAQLRLTVKSPQLWSPDTPVLYRATASCLALNTSVAFGIKHLTATGPTLRLNGAALYIHGVGDDFTYLESEGPPLDKELYRTRLQTFKRFGYNFIRLHSHFEASEYMAAAAEVGMLLSPALPMGAKNGSSHCARLDLAEHIYRRTWTSLILKYRNNPCLLDYSMGNEYYGMPGRPSFPFREEFYAIAKRLDPQRLVIDTDGCCWIAKGCGTGGTCNRTTNDFMVQFMGYTDNLVDAEQFSPYDDMPPKPIISHEAGDFNAMQDMNTALSVYTEQVNALPLSLAPAVAELKRQGLLEESSAWATASGALYVAMWKNTIEDMRTHRYISGYAWWTMYSYPGCAQGVLTADFKPKAVQPAQLASFNADAVLLLAGLPRSGISAGERILVHLSVSNYLPSTLMLSSATVNWDLQQCDASNTTSYGSGTWAPNATSILQGNITSVGGWFIPAPVVPIPTCVSLQVSIQGSVCHHCSHRPTLHNDWTFWVLPDAPTIDQTVYASAMLEQSLQQTGIFRDLRPVTNATNLSAAETTYIVNQMTPQLQALMQQGATVLCMTCSASSGGVVAYGPGLWATMGPGGARGVGTFMPEGTPLEPLARVGRWLDFSWFSHIEGAQIQPVGSTPGEPTEGLKSRSHAVPPKVLLRWLNAPCAYSGPVTASSPSFGGNRTFPNACQGGSKLSGANYALLSETLVGTAGGRLLWSGLKLFSTSPIPSPSPSPPPPRQPTLGFCPTNNFSACESAVRGAFLGDYSPNHEHVELHITKSAVLVDALYMDIQGVNPKPLNPQCNPNKSPVTVRGVIYTDFDGKPSKLVAWTSSVTLEKSAPRRFVKLQMQNGTVALPAGKYWLGNHVGPVCAVMWGSSGSAGRNPCVYGQQAFSDGPSAVFPTTGYGRCSGALSVFATYRGNAATVPVVAVENEPEIDSKGKERSTGSAGNEALPLTPWILSLLLNR